MNFLRCLSQRVIDQAQEPASLCDRFERPPAYRICDYNSYMVATLRESKAKLSELVARASEGEEILITVHGKVKARLTKAGQAAPAALGKAWADELREFHRTLKVRRKPAMPIERTLLDDREDRV